MSLYNKKLLLGLLGSVFLFVPSFAQDHIQQIDSLLEITASNNPEIGISLVFIEDENVHFANKGNTSRISEQLVSENSIYEIGSITKLFTTYLLANEVAFDRIDLTQFIDHYLHDSFNLNPSIQNTIRVSDLASHQSGLPDFNLMELIEINPSQPFDEVSFSMVDSILTNTEDLETYGCYEYSNISFALLGFILENATQNTYEELLQKHIFDPFNMQHTYSASFDVPELTTGHSPDGTETEMFNWNPVVAPAGFLKSSTHDLSFFVQALLDSRTETINSALEETLFKSTYIEMALGLNVIREGSSVVFAKTGDSLGQSGVLAYCPEGNWG
ncbi:MAG: serine hydrolase domain-containing protein, partial [Bacteroidota bacterium]